MGHATAPRWPSVVPLVRTELDGYERAASVPALRARPTRCPPWTVDDVTAHLAETFRRFADLLARSRRGDRSPPFARSELARENLRAVASFRGDPRRALAEQSSRFLDAVADPEEPMAHQLGVLPVGLQVRFALNDVVLHHDDVAAVSGGAYRPPDTVVDALLPVYAEVLGPLPAGTDPWLRIVAASGRVTDPQAPGR